MEGIGLTLKFKHDGKLFRRYTRNADDTTLTVSLPMMVLSLLQQDLVQRELCRSISWSVGTLD